MKTEEITDRIFRSAVEAIDAGEMAALGTLIVKHPYLVFDYYPYPDGAYFKNPYLLWFVADNPIRVGKLAANIEDITRLLVHFVKQHADDTMQYQLDYALGLVATGRIPRECGVQLQLMDILIDNGAKPGGGLGALAHGNTEAAKHLIERGGKLTLPAAVGLNMHDDVIRLLPTATVNDKLVALTAAAMYGKADMVGIMLHWGINPNGYPDAASGYHTHATPLHQAVSSGSLATVKLLVEAGADLNAADKMHQGTPLGWALYMPEEMDTDEEKLRFKEVEDYLREAAELKGA